MRGALILVGIALLAAGIWITAGKGSYSTTDTLAQVGSAKITATHDRTIPPWVGIAGIVIGGVLALGGFISRK